MPLARLAVFVGLLFAIWYLVDGSRWAFGLTALLACVYLLYWWRYEWRRYIETS
jgi:uncharacterized membrane protein YfcA